MYVRDNALFLESDDTWEEGAQFYATDEGLIVVEVEEEKAVDSYNAMFTCRAHLTRKQAITLRDWLTKHLDGGLAP
jgi:hypothetical protein